MGLAEMTLVLSSMDSQSCQSKYPTPDEVGKTYFRRHSILTIFEAVKKTTPGEQIDSMATDR